MAMLVVSNDSTKVGMLYGSQCECSQINNCFNIENLKSELER